MARAIVCAPDIIPIRTTVAKPSGDHIPHGGFVRSRTKERFSLVRELRLIVKTEKPGELKASLGAKKPFGKQYAEILRLRRMIFQLLPSKLRREIRANAK